MSATLLAHASQVIEFEKTLLSQVVMQANKGAAISIRLIDPVIGDLRVSARSRIDDPEQAAGRPATWSICR